MFETPNWLTLSDDYYLALGRLVVASSHLESTVFRRVALLIDFWDEFDDGGPTMLVLGTMNFSTALPLLGKLADLSKSESDLPALKGWIARAKTAMENRNRFVHWEWYRDDDEPGTAYIQAIRRKGLEGQDGVTAADVDRVTSELLEISAALTTIQIKKP